MVWSVTVTGTLTVGPPRTAWVPSEFRVVALSPYREDLDGGGGALVGIASRNSRGDDEADGWVVTVSTASAYPGAWAVMVVVPLAARPCTKMLPTLPWVPARRSWSARRRYR
jgi:hypothetical protein